MTDAAPGGLEGPECDGRRLASGIRPAGIAGGLTTER
jgi:hypothetical protein